MTTDDLFPREDEPVKGDPDAHITLVGFRNMWTLAAGPSPFCAKVETFLRFAGLHFTTQVGNPGEQPKGKLPCLLQGDNTVPDSRFIISYLEATYGDRLYEGPSVMRAPTTAQRALAVACDRLTLDHLAPLKVAFSWLADEATFENFAGGLFNGNLDIGRQYREKVKERYKQQGWMAHSRHDLLKLAEEDLTALSTILGSQLYLTGDTPCVADAALFGLLDGILYLPHIDPAFQATVARHHNLVQHVDRIREAFYSERLAELASQ